MGGYVIFELFNGFAFKSSDALETGCKWLKIANVGIGEIKWKDSSYLPEEYKNEYKKFGLKVGDIVVAMTRPTLGNQLKIARLKRESDEALLNQRVAKLLFSDKVNCEYMYQLLSTIEVALKLNSALLGTDPPNLSAKVLHEIRMEMPPLVEQQKIAAVLSNVDKEIELFEKQLADLKQEKKALMQQLLTGKRRVKLDGKEVA
jgi:type I restriction enzyme S subunit